MGKRLFFRNSLTLLNRPWFFFYNIPFEKTIQRLREVNDPKNILRECAEILNDEIHSIDIKMKHYVCDGNIVDKAFETFEIPPKWMYFLRILTNNKHKFSHNKMKIAKSLLMDIFYMTTGKDTP